MNDKPFSRIAPAERNTMFKYKSVSRKFIWYEIDLNQCDYSSHAVFMEYWKEWTDYGDTGTQHSYSSYVHLDNGTDAMLSLSKFIVDNSAALADECIGLFFPDKPDAKRVVFLSKIAHKADGKYRFFSSELMKVTTDYEKRHDKRFEEVTSYCNGSIKFITRCLLIPSFNSSILRNIALHVHVSQILDDEFPFNPFDEKNVNNDTWRSLRNAFLTLDSCIVMLRAQQYAARNVENMLANLERATEREEAGVSCS